MCKFDPTGGYALPPYTTMGSQSVWVDAETGEPLGPRERARRWIVDYHARTGRWPTIREVSTGTSTGMTTAHRAMLACVKGVGDSGKVRHE
jgi:hypothetical protein